MRSLLTLLAGLMLVVTAWGSVAQAAGPACSETSDQMAVHVANDCDEVPADADKGYPHCHTACHGHHVTTPVPSVFLGATGVDARDYVVAPAPMLTAHQVDRTLRPPQA